MIPEQQKKQSKEWIEETLKEAELLSNLQVKMIKCRSKK